MRVLIVEDDPSWRGLLRDGLRAQRIDPTLAATFAEGRDRAFAGSFDVIISGRAAARGTGFDLCGELPAGRECDARADADGARWRRRSGYAGSSGADRLSHQTVRYSQSWSPASRRWRVPACAVAVATSIADLEVDLGPARCSARPPITLSAKEFALLELFVLHRGRVLDRLHHYRACKGRQP